MFVRVSGSTMVAPVASLRDTVGSVKAQVVTKTGVLPKFQRIVYAGKELRRDNFELWEYGVQNEATLQLLGQLRGGMQPRNNGDNGAKRRKLAFKSDEDMPQAPSQQFEAWVRCKDGPARQVVAFMDGDDYGAAAAGMHTELIARGLSQAGLDRATDWAAPEKPQHECLLLMALYERTTRAFLDLQRADLDTLPPKAAPQARPRSAQAHPQGAPDPVSRKIEELEARISQLPQLRAPQIPQCTPE